MALNLHLHVKAIEVDPIGLGELIDHLLVLGVEVRRQRRLLARRLHRRLEVICDLGVVGNHPLGKGLDPCVLRLGDGKPARFDLERPRHAGSGDEVAVAHCSGIGHRIDGQRSRR